MNMPFERQMSVPLALLMHSVCWLLQNGHLKQDVVSLQKKLRDAVETNDEQVG